MEKILMQISYINGERFTRAIKAAAHRLRHHHQFLNDINVFPVADSDTGTNMAATMESIANDVSGKQEPHIGKVSERVADIALSGARGNSGAILAQFFYGLSEGLQGKIKISTQHFSDAVHRAINRSYEALAQPREGTILTVIKDWGEYIRECSHRNRDFYELIKSSLTVAKQSLKDTPKKMKILARAGVVDAGAQGFVYMLEGVLDFIDQGKIKELDQLRLSESFGTVTKTNITYSMDQITHRFCTEFYLVGQSIPINDIRTRLVELGDSVIAAGSETKVRIHIHTDDPRKVFDLVQPYGDVLEQKVDDMVQQHKDAHDGSQDGFIALVTDSCCDLPEEILMDLNIHVVPLRIYMDDIEYIDKVTMRPEEFYARLQESRSFPKTSQPTPKDFLRVYRQLSKRYRTIISLHLSEGLSGTYQSALKAAKEISDCQIHVINTRTLSTSLGLIVKLIGEAIREKKPVESLLSSINHLISSSKIILGVHTMEYLIKGGRVSKGKGLVAKLLGRTPVLEVDDNGKIVKIGMAKPGIPTREKIVSKILKEAGSMKNPCFAIVHVECPDTAAWYEEALKRHSGQDHIIVMPVSPVLGAHVGPGAAAVSVVDASA